MKILWEDTTFGHERKENQAEQNRTPEQERQ